MKLPRPSPLAACLGGLVAGFALLGTACGSGSSAASGDGAAPPSGTTGDDVNAGGDSGGPGDDVTVGGSPNDGASGSDDASPGGGSSLDASSRAPDAGGAAPMADASGASGQWVLGYYVGYQINDYPIAQIDWTGLTHIALAPMTVQSDGTPDLGFDDSNGSGEADAKALAQAAHAHGVKALLMLGGAGAGQNIAANAASGKRAAFVTALTGALTTLGYDGIDLDWEDSVNVDDLVGLAQALRAARPGIVLSYPAGAINGNYQTVDARMATLAASLDRFNVQTYYPSTAVAGSGWDSWFNSPLSGVTSSTPIAIDDTLKRYAQAGVPEAKLGMGLSFYAICYTGGITAPRQPTSGSNAITGGDNTYPLSAFFASGSQFDSSQAANRRIDSVAQVPYLTFPSAVSDSHCGGSTQYISYDDETSILAKGAFSKANGYGGIIVWTLQEGWLPANASGGRARNALMQALKHGFIDP